MIRGTVNARLEAIIRLTVFGPTGAEIEIDTIIDSGFTGNLVLPPTLIAALGLVKRSGGTATLADGSVKNFETFSAEIEWKGVRRRIVVSAVGNEALAGMVLLASHRLCMEVVSGGRVEIDSLIP